jgi:hypothetical protein
MTYLIVLIPPFVAMVGIAIAGILDERRRVRRFMAMLDATNDARRDD